MAFRSCPELLQGLRAATARQVGPYGVNGPGGGGIGDDFGGKGPNPPLARSGAEAAPGAAGARVPGAGPDAAAPPASAAGSSAAAAPGHSGTTVHEAGVDEPDLVKSDGRRIVTVTGDRLRVVDIAGRRVTGTLDLAPETSGFPSGPGQANLLLHGDRALVLSQWSPLPRGPIRPDGAAEAGPPAGSPGYGARMTLVDLSGSPRVVGRLNVDGVHLDARQVGPVARVVVRSSPHFTFPPPTVTPGTGEAAAARRRTEEYRKLVRRAPAQAWLPRYETESGGRRGAGTVPCERVRRSPAFSGTSMVSVLTVNLGGSLGNGDPVTVMADGDTVYGTPTSLYITSNPRLWTMPPPLVTPGRPNPPVPGVRDQGATEVHRFDTSRPGAPHYAASGSVPGRLLNQYALSEHQGRLRVATTTDPADPAGPIAPEGPGTPPGPGGPGAVRPAQSASAVHVLAQRGGRLTAEGSVGGLGKGERIYAVRFLGALGYVVTFRQTDPLYVLDLRDPARPRVTGELKITGYSAYLHPAGRNRLLGVGQEATEQGRTLGTQVALFDVADASRPRRLAGHHVESGSSEAETDPHAFLHWPPSGLTVLPVRRADSLTAGNEALVLKVGEKTVERLGTIRHPQPEPARPGTGPGPEVSGVAIGGDPQIRRSLVAGNTLWTVSDSGLMATDATTLDKVAWVGFS